MSHFLAAAVPWILCALLGQLFNSQAAPMAISTSSQEGQTAPASAPEAISNPPRNSPARDPHSQEGKTSSESDSEPDEIPNLQKDSPAPNPPSQKGQISSASDSEPEQIKNPPRHSPKPISPHTAPCPPDTQVVPCPNNSQTPANTESSAEKTEQNKKTGIWNALKKVIVLGYNSIYEGLVGENGYLTNLPDKIVFSTPAPPKKIQIQKIESDKEKSGGSVTTCCIFSKGGPEVQGDESDDETTDTNSVQLPPVNFVYIRNRRSNSGVAAAAAQVPIVPGVKHKIRNTQITGCCVGKRLFNLKKLFTWNFKPQINICACVINANGVEVNN